MESVDCGLPVECREESVGAGRRREGETSSNVGVGARSVGAGVAAAGVRGAVHGERALTLAQRTSWEVAATWAGETAADSLGAALPAGCGVEGWYRGPEEGWRMVVLRSGEVAGGQCGTAGSGGPGARRVQGAAAGDFVVVGR